MKVEKDEFLIDGGKSAVMTIRFVINTLWVQFPYLSKDGDVLCLGR